MTTAGGDGKESVLILVPRERDARAALAVLKNHGIQGERASSMEELLARMEGPTGALLIAEESLTPGSTAALKSALAAQPAWSDLPVLLLTSAHKRKFGPKQIIAHFELGGNISVLERPLRILTLVSSALVSIRARRKQYEVAELLRLQSAALRQREDFLSIASHELKTPLATLKLQLQLKRRKLDGGSDWTGQGDQVRRFILSAEDQVGRLNRLVDDMLDISRVDSGKLALNLERCELGKIVNDVKDALAENFRIANFTVELRAEGEVWGLWDCYRIEQVVMNLFTNAIRYGASPLWVRVFARDNRAICEVQDHGNGIAPADQARIFQRFERAESRQFAGGLGLGLYITREIIELHGGSITVTSEPGQGATFRFELPFGRNEAV